MSKAQRILLGKGLDDLPFGAKRKDVKAVFGEPDEEDEIDLGDEVSIAWHFWELGVSLNFDESAGYGLCTIEVADSEVTLFDESMMGWTRKRCKEFLDGKKIGKSEDEVHNGLAYPDVELNLWFNGGELAEIQWGVL